MPLKISLQDTQYSYEQMNVRGKMPFGDREWEQCLATLERSVNVPAKDSVYAAMRLEFLFENERAQNGDGWAHMLTRDIITYVYAAVYSALKHNLPLVRRQDIGAIAVRYPATIDEACVERVRKDAIRLLTTMNEGWGMQFQILTANAPIDRISLFFACTCVIALLRKFSVPAENPKAKEAPKMPRTPEERRSAALKKAEDTTTILPFRSAVTFDDIGGCRAAKEQLQNLARRVDQWSVVQRWGGATAARRALARPAGYGKNDALRSAGDRSRTTGIPVQLE